MIGREGAVLVGQDFPIESGTGCVVNVVRPVAFTVERQPYGDEIAAPAAPIDTECWPPPFQATARGSSFSSVIW